ncbi:DUF4214 domain-containing protein (plasmid) [Sinorhizobium meliloti WSM1022]|uniref:DUF4214 domain-containing protein n=1 Tax=Rhizobium meliloti (strain 1021) TaxID=266834 RepID=Q92VQ1_RHIME|nr:DUF4214 domain-containing protein [Sinorhizobium meliloti]ASP62213.1 hypothetical protein CDO30_28930 [Sinorhizobium meliloti]MCK3804867.1 DUF4214 domain-containing protein [Sinorhizobium meliloti]MCK3810874.1 DUF4214 domain-containing protein [Sinorhizobium meliloti]MCK3815912.1 DUF4214 domain-containing protein [Sinorhizobium meliloti]MDE3877560.1 DUF4214 domain-containing protein [Sinorhizobium meliloti]
MFTRLAIGTLCLLTTAASGFADILWGVNGHPITAYPGIGIEQQLNYLEDLGMKSYRVNISDAVRVRDLAALVKEGKARGIEILPVITPGNIDLDKDSVGKLYEKAHRLAVTLGSQFKADIRVWELGNEMENYAIIKACEKRDDGSQYPCEWGPAGGVGPLDYYGPRWAKVSAVLRGLSDGMTAVDPQIRKAVGTAGWGHVGAFERMKQDGIDWDISVWHMYGEDPEWAFKELARYGHPIWVTEFNNPLGSQRSDEQQADGLRQAMMRLRELHLKYSVEAAHVYELLDETYWAPNFEAYMGLVKLIETSDGGWATGEPKSAYAAAREVILGKRPVVRPKRDCEISEVRASEPLSVRQGRFAYCLVLGHRKDAGAIARWAEALENGQTNVTEMMLTLMQSDEFNRRYATFGLTDRPFISFLYLLLMDRSADPHGLDSYAGHLSGGTMTRENVALGMMLSSEFQRKYAAHLGAGQ